MQAAVAQATERFGGLDVVMANAGIATYGTVLNVDPAAFYRLIDINVNGVFNTVRAAPPSIIDRQGCCLGRLVTGRHAVAPSLAAYGTSESRSRELRQRVAVGDPHLASTSAAHI